MRAVGKRKSLRLRQTSDMSTKKVRRNPLYHTDQKRLRKPKKKRVMANVNSNVIPPSPRVLAKSYNFRAICPATETVVTEVEEPSTSAGGSGRRSNPFFFLDTAGSKVEHTAAHSEDDPDEVVIVGETRRPETRDRAAMLPEVVILGSGPRIGVTNAGKKKKSNFRPQKGQKFPTRWKPLPTNSAQAPLPPPPSPATLQDVHFQARAASRFGTRPPKGSRRLPPTLPTGQPMGNDMSNVFVAAPSMSTGEQKRNFKKGTLRPIVIDGSNVAHGHGETLGLPGPPPFSCRGIEICVDYFKKRGHSNIMVIVPHYRLMTGQARDQGVLHSLKKANALVLTPSRHVPGGQSYQAYDDRYIVQYAAVNGGVIVSNDNYRDLINESDAMREAIEQRLLMFNFMDSQVLIFPQDPLGRNGPSLDEFLVW